MNAVHKLLIETGAAGLIALSTVVALAGELRAGAGRASVTTDTADFPFQPSDRPSLNTGPGERSFVGVHDEVFARALVMDDGSHRVALVSLEVTAVPAASEISKAIARELRVQESNVVVVATHTHSVPLFSYAGGEPNARERKEIEHLKSGAVSAAREANSRLQSAQIAFGRGESWINVNNGEQSGSKAGYDPMGPSDKTVEVVRLDARGGKPIALIVNYSSHAEVMFRSVTRDDGYEVSGDLPGAVSRLLEAQAIAPIVIFTSGAEADQLTLFKSLQYPGQLPSADETSAGWAILDVQARRLTESVMQVRSDMPAGVAHANVSSAAASVSCPGQQLSLDPKTGHTNVEDKPPVVIPLSMIKINDIVLAGVGGDVATEIGQHFKSSSPIADSMFMSMAGSSVGYVFSDAGYIHPGHGLTKSLLKPGCADHAIVDGLVRMIESAR